MTGPRPAFETGDETPARPVPRWLSWLRLARVPNVFTAMADSLMGYVAVQRGWGEDWRVPVVVALASASLYTAGMILNDWFDRERDARERPFRPLPSGQIRPATAAAAGFGLLAVGLLLGIAAGIAGRGLPAGLGAGHSGLFALLLVVCILAYNGWLKATWLGPLAMGSCRFFNVALGMAAAALVPPKATWGAGWLGLSGPHWAIAGAIGLYVTGITWFARTETGPSRRLPLLGAVAVMVAGVALLGQGVSWLSPRLEGTLWWLLLGLLLLTVVRRCGMAIADPEPGPVQMAVKQGILSLIWFDAAVGLALAGPQQGLALAALLVPALLLGRWVYST